MLADCFPQTRQACPGLLDWTLPFAWSSPLEMGALRTLLDAQIEAAATSMAALKAISEPLWLDLVAATEAAADKEEESANVDIVRFLAGLPVSASATMEGDYGLAYDWLLGSISRTFQMGRNINTAEFTPPPYRHGDPVANDTVTDNLVRWYGVFYSVAQRLGGLDELARRFAPAATAIALANLGSATRMHGVRLIAVLAGWMAEREMPQAAWFAGQLQAMLTAEDFLPRDKVVIGTALTGRISIYTGHCAGHWARYVLANFEQDIVEHERVQLQVLAADSEQSWLERRKQILDDIRALANFYRDRSRAGGEASVILESRVTILHPMFHGLATFGGTEDIMDVLWAWYGQPGRKRADPDILFVCPAYGDGTAYVWPGGRSLPAGDDPANLDRFLTTLSLAHSQMFRGPDGDRPLAVEEHRWGQPNHDYAAQLRLDMAALYDFDRLRAALPQDFRPRAIVVVPAHRDPIQAELAIALGWLAPLEASVAQAAPERPRRVIGIWRDDEVQLVDAEIELLRATAPLCNWEVRIYDGPRQVEDFRRFYEDPEPDILWVIGHGEMDAHDLTLSGLVLANRIMLPMTVVAGFVVPELGRRLLVLNICSGGAAQIRGGMARLGLAQALAGPHQHVVAHQWPVDSYFALRFAASLLLSLPDAPVAEALRRASALMRDPDRLREELHNLDPKLTAIDRLQTPLALNRAQSVLNWGNAAVYT